MKYYNLYQVIFKKEENEHGDIIKTKEEQDIRSLAEFQKVEDIQKFLNNKYGENVAIDTIKKAIKRGYILKGQYRIFKHNEE